MRETIPYFVRGGRPRLPRSIDKKVDIAYLRLMPVRRRIGLDGPALFFVTTTVVKWLPLFSRDDLALATLTQFAETANVFRSSIFGYVLMPSHLHAMIGLPDGRLLSRLMQSFKSLSSRRLKRMELGGLVAELHRRDAFAIWQRGFDDLCVTSEQQFRIKLEYIHNNPVRQGLSRTAAEYGYSSARDWIEDRQGLILVDKGFSYMKSVSYTHLTLPTN